MMTRKQAVSIEFALPNLDTIPISSFQFAMPYNSNHWTARGLRIADLNTPLWAGHATAIMHLLESRCYP